MRLLRLARGVSRGFTLLELMVVVTVIAIGSAGVALTLREGSQTALDRDADRLAAILEAARAQSRSSGATLRFRPLPAGFVIEGLPQAKPQTWLNEATRVEGAAPLDLGPEPIIEPRAITLQLSGQTRVLSTDGLRPFRVRGTDGP